MKYNKREGERENIAADNFSQLHRYWEIFRQKKTTLRNEKVSEITKCSRG